MKCLALFVFSFLLFVAFSQAQQCDPNHRVDCGYSGITQQQCLAKGCCWQPFQHVPWCFFKYSPPPAYVLSAYTPTSNGFTGTLTIQSNGNNVTGPYGTDISPLRLSVFFNTQYRLHVKIDDPNNSRWQVPNVVTTPDPPVKPANTDYNFLVNANPFGFAVVRKSTNEVLFNSTANGNQLVFEDQFIEIGTGLPTPNYIYGLGEHVTSLPLQPNTYTMWAADHATPVNQNLYGSHPFYVDVRTSSGNAHGVFLLNSNGMDVVLTSNSLSFLTIGGIIDLYFFTGPTPETVIQQYTELIGRPYLIPYWSLGFHQCRYGYPDLPTVESVVQGYAQANIPLETMWNDIDYMDNYLDFTFDPTRYPPDQVAAFVEKLHQNHQQYVVITDPGISYQATNYPPLDEGNQLGLWVKDASGQPFKGSVWPGPTYYPDFFHPSSTQWWTNQIKRFHDMVPIDGLWIDMNEYSNFCNGECGSEEKPKKVGFDPNNPPYKINNYGSQANLNVHTLSPDAVHYNNSLEYNVHNMMGNMESRATNAALKTVRGKRPFVISRSTFPSSGSFAGHWTGDISSQWSDLYYTIPDMLMFNMFGIPMIGADIGGFNGNTNEELLGRWIEVGAFYPFSRDHNSKGNDPQELYVYPSVANISRTVLAIRYSLLPYYYTLFYQANTGAVGTVVRPLVFEFPTDSTAANIDHQFLVGSGLLISPVLTQGATSVQAYFPQANWYDYYTFKLLTSTAQTITLDAPFEKINIHLRGGTIIPTQDPAYSIYETRQNPYSLLVPLDQTGSSSGSLFIDDGDSLGTVENGQYTYITYTQTYSAGNGGEISNNIVTNGYSGVKTLSLTAVYVLGVPSVKSVTVNNQNWSYFSFDSSSQSLTILNLNLPIANKFVINWQ